MWRIVCKGPGPIDSPRRVVDRGPLHTEKAHAQAFANFLRSTGLYESVELVASLASTAEAGLGVAKKSGDDAIDPAKLFD